MDDYKNSVDAAVLRAALAALVVAVPAWTLLSLTIVLGRVWRDRTHAALPVRLSEREASRLVRRAAGRPRTEWGRWRRVTAVSRLARERHPAARRLVRPLVEDPDPALASAAIRVLGDLGDDWAIDSLVRALTNGYGPRSRIATELERLAPAPGPKLVPLLRSRQPIVRFWGATLLRPYPELAGERLVALTWDTDPSVRAAAAETLATRSGPEVGTALLACLEDGEWLVRTHAARAVAEVVGVEAAPTISRLLADDVWWVRLAAKDSLRALGRDAVPSLVSLLTHASPAARSGAAEVLQDIGFVDDLVRHDPGSRLLARIYVAGGDRFRVAAEARAAGQPEVARAA
jgi:HEAT repeat protein